MGILWLLEILGMVIVEEIWLRFFEILGVVIIEKIWVIHSYRDNSALVYTVQQQGYDI